MQLSEENSFLVVCACLAGLFLMLGSMCLQYGLAYAGMAVCLPYQIAVSISVGKHTGCCKHLIQRLLLCAPDGCISGREQGERSTSVQKAVLPRLESMRTCLPMWTERSTGF